MKPGRGIPLWRRLCSWLALAALMLAASGRAEGQGFCGCAGYSFRVGAVEPIDCYQVRVPVFIAGPSGADELNGLVVQGGLNAGSGAIKGIEIGNSSYFDNFDVQDETSFTLSKSGTASYPFTFSTPLFSLIVEAEPGAAFGIGISNSFFTVAGCSPAADCQNISVVYDFGPPLDGPAAPGSACPGNSQGSALRLALDLSDVQYEAASPSQGQAATVKVKLFDDSSPAYFGPSAAKRIGFEITYDDVYGNLAIEAELNSSMLNGGSIDHATPGLIKFELEINTQIFIFTAGVSPPLASIKIEAPNNPPAGGEAEFSAGGYARLQYDGGQGAACCAPGFIGGAVVLDGALPPCTDTQGKEAFIELREPQYSPDGLARIPVHLATESGGSPEYEIERLLVEIEVFIDGDARLLAGEIQASLGQGFCPYSGQDGCDGPTGFPAEGCLEVLEEQGLVRFGFCDFRAVPAGRLFDIVLSGTCGSAKNVWVRRAEWETRAGGALCNLRSDSESPAPWPIELEEGGVRLFCGTRLGVPGVKLCGFDAEQICNCGDTGACGQTDGQGGFDPEDFGGAARRIAACKSSAARCGVSTLDLVIINRHLLGIEPFKETWQYIAADANNNNFLSTLDLIYLRRLILGIIPELPASWRFIPCDYCFDDLDPFDPEAGPFPEQCLDLSQYRPCFKAIKVGDVNCDCGIGAPIGLGEIEVALSVAAGSQQGRVKVGLEPLAFDSIAAFQFAIGYDTSAAAFHAVLAEDLPMFDSGAYRYEASEPGLLRFAWFDTTGAGLSLAAFERLFSIEVEPLLPGGLSWQDVWLDTAAMPALFYRHDGTPLRPVFSFGGSGGGHRPLPSASSAAGLSARFRPSPFGSTLELELEAGGDEAASQAAELRIFDLHGACIYRQKLLLETGRAVLPLPAAAHWAAGMYFYTLETGAARLSGKLIKQ